MFVNTAKSHVERGSALKTPNALHHGDPSLLHHVLGCRVIGDVGACDTQQGGRVLVDQLSKGTLITRAKPRDQRLLTGDPGYHEPAVSAKAASSRAR